MVIKYGPHGKFLACPGFPECRNTKPYLEKIGVACPKLWKRCCNPQDEKRTESITAVKTIRSASLCPGRNLPQKSVRNVAAICCDKGNKIVCADEECGYVTN